ncbi:MAG: hypothetical protein WCG45_06395 [bacterium]
MRRFDYDNNEDEFRNEVDKFFNDGEGKSDTSYPYPLPMDMDITIEGEDAFILAEKEFNLKIYRTAVKIAENSFFWRFYSFNTRLNIINKIYKDIEEKNAEV